MKNGIFFLALTVGALLTGCNNDRIFDKTYDLQNAQWSYQDTLSFAFDVRDTAEIYDIVLHLSHGVDYPMQNLYMNIYTAFPGGQRVKQLLNIDLADQTGKWNGKISGKTCDYEIKIQENAFFNALGKHTITLEPFMRVNPLPAIKSVGLTVIDTKHKKGEK